MNIFYLNKSPKVSASMQTNKHVVKMILEAAQMLSAAHHILDGDDAPAGIYKLTHKNHPSTIWVRQSDQHYNWLYDHFIALCNEYTERYGKIHLTERKLSYVLKTPPVNIPSVGFVQPPCAMPDQYKVNDNSVQSYRNYYIAEKIKTNEDEERFNSFL